VVERRIIFDKFTINIMPPPPEKHVTLAYAATASLAAATLVYVFGPTWFIDSAPTSSKDRKKGVVGLANPANDCFVWSSTMRRDVGTLLNDPRRSTRYYKPWPDWRTYAPI